MRPSGASWAYSASGTDGAAAATAIPSNGSPLGNTERAVADPHLDSVVAGGGERPARALGECCHTLDRDDLGRELCQHGRLVTGPGPDVEDALVALEIEGGADRRDHEGLRDRLPVADRKRTVVVGPAAQLLGDEALARYAADGFQHARVADPPSAEESCEIPARRHVRTRARAYAGGATPK